MIWRRWSLAQRVAVARWFVFTVCLGTLPVLFAFLTATAGTGLHVHPIGDGGLYLVSSILAFTAVGELLGTEALAADQLFRVVGGGIAMMVGLCAAYLFAQVSSVANAHGGFVVVSSGVLWVASVLVGVTCAVRIEGG